MWSYGSWKTTRTHYVNVQSSFNFLTSLFQHYSKHWAFTCLQAPHCYHLDSVHLFLGISTSYWDILMVPPIPDNQQIRRSWLPERVSRVCSHCMSCICTICTMAVTLLNRFLSNLASLVNEKVKLFSQEKTRNCRVFKIGTIHKFWILYFKRGDWKNNHLSGKNGRRQHLIILQSLHKIPVCVFIWLS